MYKLLKADFFRLKKDSIFWLFICSGIIGGAYSLFHTFRAQEYGKVVLEDTINGFIMFIGFFIAIFVSIFVGKEYSDGIIRNKIIVGHSKISIYLSKLITSIFASMLCELFYIIIVFTVGTLLSGKLQIPLREFAMCMLNTFLIIIVYCSIYNFVAMICSEITVSTIICMGIFIAMFVADTAISYIANSSKYITHSYSENDVQYIINQEPDPNYPGDEKVKLAQTVELLMPEGQAIHISNTNYSYKMPIYSISEILVFNIAGIYLFSKKELK